MIYSKYCGYFCDFECDFECGLVWAIQPLPSSALSRTMSDLKVSTYEDPGPPVRCFKYGPTMWRLVRCRPMSRAWSGCWQP
jgi:hypothetical protein